MRTPTTVAAPALLAVLGLAAAGCGGQEVRPESPPGSESPSSSGAGGGQAETELTIDISTESGEQSGSPDAASSPSTSPSPPQKWRLTCEPVGGDHPEPKTACADLDDAGGAEAFEETAEDSPCTFIYGGPEVAQVTGHVDDTEIDTEITKADGCELERYEDLGALLTP